MGATTKTVIKLLILTYRKRRTFFIVEGATGLVITSGFFEANTAIYQLDNIGACDHVIDKYARDTTSHLTTLNYLNRFLSCHR